MPLFYQQDINDTTRLAIWKIEEAESFFSSTVPIQREITHPHKRLQHYAGRYLLRYLFPDFPYEEILIADTKKPYLPYEQYHFSISHCGDYAAAIVSSNKRVGIDIEIPKDRILNIRHKFLHPEELNSLLSQTTYTYSQVLTILWCAKEAMYKWWGWGLVDFKEMLRIGEFNLQAEGVMSTRFIKDSIQIPLPLHYKQFEKLCLAWVMNENTL